MDDRYEVYERNGLKVTILHDMDPESPRDWDNVGTMICSHRGYTLGDEQFDPSDFDGWEDLKKHLVEERGAVIILPLSLYDHSGISMFIPGDGRYRQHEAWDSGQVGFIFATEEDIKHCGLDKELAEKQLRGEVFTYNQFLEGDVYGFKVEDERTGEEIDSCWGIFGSEYAIEEADSVADSYKHPRESVFAKKASLVHG